MKAKNANATVVYPVRVYPLGRGVGGLSVFTYRCPLPQTGNRQPVQCSVCPCAVQAPDCSLSGLMWNRGPSGKQRQAKQAEEPPLQEGSPEWETAREKLLAYAFGALSRRALSEAELRQRLLQRSVHTELIEHVLARVRELGYQNDAIVAESEARRRGVGHYRVRQKLKQRGLDEDLIRETLEERDPEAEEHDAREQLRKRLSSFARKNNPKASAYAWLTRRGYPADLIRRLLEEVADELPEPERSARRSFGRTPKKYTN